MLRKGTWLGKSCMGYKNVRNEQGVADIIVDESTAHIVITMFDLYASGAYSMSLLKDKIYTDFGISLPKGSLGKMLNNMFYISVMTVKGKQYPHRYPRLVSQIVFDKVQTIIAGFTKKPVKYRGKNYIYRGVVRCGDYGLSATPEMHKGYVYYHCTQYNGKHGTKWLREEDITKQLSALFKRLQMPEQIAVQITDNLNVVHKKNGLP